MLANFNGIFQDTLTLAAVGVGILSFALLALCSLCGWCGDRACCREHSAVLQTARDEAIAATFRLVA